MAINVPSLIKMADRLLQNGDDATLVNVGAVIYDPLTGSDTSTDINYHTIGYVDDYTLSQIDDIKVKIDDLRILVRVDVEVEEDWKVLYRGKTWYVKTVRKIRAKNTTLTQELQVRANG